MSTSVYVKQTYPIECRGYNKNGEPALLVPVGAEVIISMSPGSNIISSVIENCPHNTGSHGQRCKASHPNGVNKVGDGVVCPFAFDLPYALLRNNQCL